MAARSITVLGIGNPARGDDGAGRAVIARLRGTLPAEVALVEQDGEATALLDSLAGLDVAFIVDACVAGGAPGSVHRFDAGAEPLPQAAFGLSSHGLGLGEAVELGRALGQLPGRLIVYAIEGAAFEIGAPLSLPVAAAAAKVADSIRAEIVAVAAHA